MEPGSGGELDELTKPLSPKGELRWTSYYLIEFIVKDVVTICDRMDLICDFLKRMK